MKPKNAPRPIGKPQAVGPVTADNYHERSQSFMRASGSGFIIRSLDGADGAIETGKPATEAEWMAWLHYFDRIGLTCSYGRKTGVMAVPCRWPEDFDDMAHKSDKTARQPVSQRAASRVAAGAIKALGGALQRAAPRPLRPPAPKPKTAEDLATEYAHRPLTISPELRVILSKMSHWP